MIELFYVKIRMYLSSVERRRPNPSQLFPSSSEMQQGETGKKFTKLSLIEISKELKQLGLIGTEQ